MSTGGGDTSTGHRREGITMPYIANIIGLIGLVLILTGYGFIPGVVLIIIALGMDDS